MYSIFFSTSDLFSFIISNTDKHEFSCKGKRISRANDGMNHVDCFIEHDVYPQKMHLTSKTIRVSSKNICGIYKICIIIGVIAWVFI